MNMSLAKITDTLLCLFLFLLPWQTRWIYSPAFINGSPWEYGTKSLYATELLLCLVIGLGFFRLIRDASHPRASWSRRTSSAVIVVVLGFVALCIGHSFNPGVSYQAVTWLLLGLWAMLLILTSQYSARTLALALWLGGVVQALFGMGQFFMQQVTANTWFGLASHTAKELGASVIEFGDERWLRAYGSFGSPNSLGIYLAVVFVVGLILYLGTTSNKVKLLITVGQLVILGGLILSFSRGAWLSGVAGLAAIFLCVVKTPLRNVFLKQAGFYTLITLFFILALQPLFFARFTPSNRLEARSLGERASQLHEALTTIKEYPLLGVGPGAYTVALAAKHPEARAFELQPVHNIYFLTIAQWGLLASFVFAVIYILLFKKVWQMSRLGAAIIVTLTVAGLFDHWLATLFTGQLIWFVGWALALRPDGIILPENKNTRP